MLIHPTDNLTYVCSQLPAGTTSWYFLCDAHGTPASVEDNGPQFYVRSCSYVDNQLVPPRLDEEDIRLLSISSGRIGCAKGSATLAELLTYLRHYWQQQQPDEGGDASFIVVFDT